jgi:hypothetical protein
MDEIVKQAIAKWPNVPHCYGWLNLDARGHWRMRDERAQQLNLPGDKLSHTALLAFIARNYGHDERGCWFFQNGPQRVYLNLEATPYIVRTDPAHGWLLHTGTQLGAPHAAYLTETGELILRSGDVVAQLDDRDAAQALAGLEMAGEAVDDDALLAWLDDGVGALTLRIGAQLLTVQRLPREQVAGHFGFVRQPEPAATTLA